MREGTTSCPFVLHYYMYRRSHEQRDKSPLITKPIKAGRSLYILFFSELLIGLLVSCIQTEPNYPLNPKVNRPKN